ncbi:hypothetical protein ACFQ12_18845, partial [Methylobacterium trifolii]
PGSGLSAIRRAAFVPPYERPHDRFGPLATAYADSLPAILRASLSGRVAAPGLPAIGPLAFAQKP